MIRTSTNKALATRYGGNPPYTPGMFHNLKTIATFSIPNTNCVILTPCITKIEDDSNYNNSDNHANNNCYNNNGSYNNNYNYVNNNN